MATPMRYGTVMRLLGLRGYPSSSSYSCFPTVFLRCMLVRVLIEREALFEYRPVGWLVVFCFLFFTLFSCDSIMWLFFVAYIWYLWWLPQKDCWYMMMAVRMMLSREEVDGLWWDGFVLLGLDCNVWESWHNAYSNNGGQTLWRGGRIISRGRFSEAIISWVFCRGARCIVSHVVYTAL